MRIYSLLLKGVSLKVLKKKQTNTNLLVLSRRNPKDNSHSHTSQINYKMSSLKIEKKPTQAKLQTVMKRLSWDRRDSYGCAWMAGKDAGG